MSQIIVLAILILINAFFAATEIAFISLNDAKIEKQAKEGNKKAKQIKKMLREPSKFLATIQIGITLAGFLSSAFAADAFADDLAPMLQNLMPLGLAAWRNISIILITIILSYFSLIFGELVPKRLAMRNSEKIAFGTIGIIRAISIITAPFVKLLTASTNGVSKLFGISGTDEETVTEDNKTSYDTSVVSSDIAVLDAARVLSSVDSDGTVIAPVEDAYYQDGVISVEFKEDVNVSEIYAPDDRVTTVDEAYETLTKQDAENEIYEVKQGDCLTFIAENHGLYMAELLALNPGLAWDSTLVLGQQIVVTVPKPELSVVVKEEVTTEEEFNVDVQYVDNPDVYSGTNTVIQEAVPGTRQAVALVEYTNGTETARTLLKESVTREAVPQIIERGTKEMPTYIKPISGGTLTSTFGKRWGTIHYGVDWGCPIGTNVKASCTGKVITAGWQNGYGYTVVLAHSDGSTTRYAHLSKIAVSVGQSVSQGEVIAYSGNTGNSTGPHLHFEITIGGSRVNPLEYLE